MQTINSYFISQLRLICLSRRTYAFIYLQKFSYQEDRLLTFFIILCEITSVFGRLFSAHFFLAIKTMLEFYHMYVQKLYCRLQIYILPTLSSILAVIFLFEVSLQGCLLQTKFLWQDKCHKKIEFFHLVHYVFVCKSSLIYFAQTRRCMQYTVV